MENAKKEQEKKEEKKRWIGENGSERLKMAFKKGYSCEKQYISERGEKELGRDYILDYDAKVETKNRLFLGNCALEENASVNVVWVTKDTKNNEDEDDYEEDDEDFVEYEAVEVKYLEHYFYKRI